MRLPPIEHMGGSKISDEDFRKFMEIGKLLGYTLRSGDGCYELIRGDGAISMRFAMSDPPTPDQLNSLRIMQEAIGVKAN